MKPIIGITGNERLFQTQDDNNGFLVNYTPREYSQVIEQVGGIPIIMPMTDEPLAEEYIQLVDGLLLTGGQDISPHLYRQEPRQVIGEISPKRDQTEIALIKAALKYNKPILAVCRGMQLLNVYFGGTLYQDLTEIPDISIQHVQKTKPQIPTHTINIVEDTQLYQIMGAKSQINSYHHQAINELGNGLTISALSPDHVIEAFESKKHNIVAVQWHPELTANTQVESLNIFKNLVTRAS